MNIYTDGACSGNPGDMGIVKRQLVNINSQNGISIKPGNNQQILLLCIILYTPSFLPYESSNNINYIKVNSPSSYLKCFQLASIAPLYNFCNLKGKTFI